MALNSSPVVLVTGASRGIGLAVATILLESLGAQVVTLSRSTPPELKELSSKYTDRISIIEGDITDPSSHTTAVSKAISVYGRLDAIILNAGTLDPLGRISSEEASVDQWKTLFDVNVFSLLHTLKASLPHLREIKGRAIFVSSGASVGGSVGWGAYSASKATMNSIVRTLGSEETDVVSIAIRPGVVDTSMQEAIRAQGEAHMTSTDYNRFVSLHSDAKLLKPEEPAYVLAQAALTAPKELSGKYLSWDGDELKSFRKPS